MTHHAPSQLELPADVTWPHVSPPQSLTIAAAPHQDPYSIFGEGGGRGQRTPPPPQKETGPGPASS